MQDAAAIDSEVRVTSGSPVRMQNVPLTFLSDGDCAMIAQVRGKGDLHHHLENLGFVEGAEVRVVSEQSGNIIVEVKGSQVALDKSVAMKIITCA